ncbi:MAG: hypothetical protein K5919_03775 [Clostridiales bacterium]|nr:hypothetical protein [Clostridiales bacterium]
MTEKKADSRLRKLKPLIAPAAAFLFLLGLFILFQSMNSQNGARMNGMAITAPPGYRKTYSDDRFVVWEYQEGDKKPGKLILDAGIRGEHAQSFFDAQSVLAECSWLTDAEIYVNPQGVRMARGFSQQYSGYPERRYYVESETTVFLLCMSEDSRYYRPADCEEALLQTADSIRPANK